MTPDRCKECQATELGRILKCPDYNDRCWRKHRRLMGSSPSIALEKRLTRGRKPRRVKGGVLALPSSDSYSVCGRFDPESVTEEERNRD